MIELPAHDVMVANILTVYARATPTQQLEGCRWYPTAHRIATAIAEATGSTPQRVTLALSALSPRNPWLWSVADAYCYAAAVQTGAPRPSATTFKTNQVKAWRALQGTDDPWHGLAPKVRAFVAAIMGDRDAVVVDTWATRVATGVNMRQISDRTYAKIAAAYVTAALTMGVDARDIQAITWLVAQSEGIASERRGRHDLSFKRGTPDFVRGILK